MALLVYFKLKMDFVPMNCLNICLFLESRRVIQILNLSNDLYQFNFSNFFTEPLVLSRVGSLEYQLGNTELICD